MVTRFQTNGGSGATNKAAQIYANGRSANKYGAKKVTTEDGRFDSKAELKRWEELKLLERGKHITGLKRQVAYPIVVNGKPICKYIADFVYHENGKLTVEDVKGHRTKLYSLKRKLIESCYDFTITEVEAR